MPPSIYLRKSSGFTLLEVVISIGIIMTLSSVVLSSMSTFRASQTLDAAVEKTLSAFSLSRLDTISSKNDSAYGVRVLQDRVTYFKGTVYPGNGDVNNLDFANNTADLAKIIAKVDNALLYDKPPQLAFEH